MKSIDALKAFYDIYSGIVSNNTEFDGTQISEIKYEFDAPELKTLKEKYNIEKLAKTGTNFDKAKRLTAHFAPRLTHKSNYDNHVPCNSLDLLNYSYENPNQGINCLNKAKILEECLLSLGIYARRTGIYPYSPFDGDNHIVTEFFDDALQKWIMIDPSTSAYIIDENKKPLSMLEYREIISKYEFATIITTSQSDKNPEKLFEKNIWTNQYFAKNAFCFTVDAISTFGESENAFEFYPKGFDVIRRAVANCDYIISNADKFELDEGIISFYEKRREKQKERKVNNYDISVMVKKPV